MGKNPNGHFAKLKSLIRNENEKSTQFAKNTKAKQKHSFTNY